MSGKRVAILGATGVVGQKVIEVLVERGFPMSELKLLATARTAGSVIKVNGQDVPVQEVTSESFRGTDVCFFAATTGASEHYGPIAANNGAVVIDKSNAFRMNPNVPLVVPEVNAHHLRGHKGIIASPNCSTIQMVVALKPILDMAGIERIIVSTYQSVSGTGKEAIEELRVQAGDVLAGRPAQAEVYDRQIAFNLIAQIDSFGQDDYTGEEWKMVHETRKIFDIPGLPVTATCVRVPVYVSHSEAVLVETKTPLSVARAREALAAAPSVVLVDDPQTRKFSTPKDAEGSAKVFVSRVRKDVSSERGLWMWVVSDNLRKGAATNAVQIAESLVAQALL